SRIEELRPAMQILDAGLSEFKAHHARQHAADDAGDDREDQVERADVLVVGRHEPSDENAGLVIMVVMRMIVAMDGCSRCNISHFLGPSINQFVVAGEAAGVAPGALAGVCAGAVVETAGTGPAGAAAAAAGSAACGSGLPPFERTHAFHCSIGTASTAIGI